MKLRPFHAGEVEAKRLYPENVANFNSGLKIVRDWFDRSILCFVVFPKIRTCR